MLRFSSMHVRAHGSAGRMCMELLLLDCWAARLATYVVYGTAYSVVLQWRYRDDSLGRRKGRSVVEGEEVEPCARTSNQGWVTDCWPQSFVKSGCGTLSRKKIFEQRWRQIFWLKLFKIRISQVFALIEIVSHFLSGGSATMTTSAGMAGTSGCFHAKNVKWRHLMFFLDFSIFWHKIEKFQDSQGPFMDSWREKEMVLVRMHLWYFRFL